MLKVLLSTFTDWLSNEVISVFIGQLKYIEPDIVVDPANFASILQGFFCFLVFGLGQRSVRMAFMRKKYQPTYPSSALLGNHINNSSSSLLCVKV